MATLVVESPSITSAKIVVFMYAETNGHAKRSGGAGNNLVNYCVDESKMSTLMRRGKAVKTGN